MLLRVGQSPDKKFHIFKLTKALTALDCKAFNPTKGTDMTCLDPKSRLGRAILSGKLRAVRVTPRKGEDVADAFIRGIDPKVRKAFEARIDAIIKGKKS